MYAMRTVSLLRLLLLGINVSANVEKVIFLGPRTPTLEQVFVPPLLHLDTLSPSESSLRRQLLARFPSTPASRTLSESWILVDGLQASQRYEIRVCWIATQPTLFELSVHDLATVFRTPTLNSSIYEYFEAQIIESSSGGKKQDKPSVVDYSTTDIHSSLLLHVSATADYYSRDAALMRDGLLVDLDIILDPYLLNIFPQSLAPTGVYLVVLAILSWAISGIVWHWFRSLAHPDGQDPQHQVAESFRKKHS
ncbi:hypothetical protein MMC11_005552 [Xylographa trunciseda]|nr:hypothetical protein [Xylographa trunciseda]